MEHPQSAIVTAQEGKQIPMIGTVKLAGDRTGESFELIEYTGPAVPPPHVHRNRDEAFVVLDGVFHFVVGEEDLEAVPGTIVHVRRGTRHAFSAEPGSRALLLVVPAGLGGFFEELGHGLAAGRSGQELRDVLADRYDSEPA